MKIFYTLLLAFIILSISLNIGEAMESNKTSLIRANSIDSTNVKKVNQKKEIGIGPIKKLKLGSLDEKLVNEGKSIFNDKCSACHSLDIEVEGPALRAITKKLRPEYIMNYLLNTTDMQRRDPLMQKLVGEYKVMMPDQQLTRDDARAILEYLRSVEK